ncbi:hypothetical protein JTB14_001904 [Gonioctena quinquepunctata]|nr:hypothetical protein JTB14_001904 [Gonioctena quinquepunctata]
MSLKVINLKRKRPNEQLCLFCNKSNDLVKEPRSCTLLYIEKAADRRKDNITEEILKLYNLDSTRQEFSWHQGCLATYLSEKEIRRRKIASCEEKEESASTSRGKRGVTFSKISFVIKDTCKSKEIVEMPNL